MESVCGFSNALGQGARLRVVSRKALQLAALHRYRLEAIDYRDVQDPAITVAMPLADQPTAHY